MAIGTLALCYNNIEVFRGVVKLRRGKFSVSYFMLGLVGTKILDKPVYPCQGQNMLNFTISYLVWNCLSDKSLYGLSTRLSYSTIIGSYFYIYMLLSPFLQV